MMSAAATVLALTASLLITTPPVANGAANQAATRALNGAANQAANQAGAADAAQVHDARGAGIASAGEISALERALGTADFHLVELPLFPAAPDILRYELPAAIVPADSADDVVELELERRSVRASDFRLLVETAEGTLEQRPAPRARTYRGHSTGASRSAVTASLGENGELFALVHGEYGSWQVQPVDAFVAGMPPGVHVCLDSLAFDVPAGRCGTVEPGRAEELGSAAAGVSRSTSDGSDHVCDIAVDCDFEYYQLNGGNVRNTLRDVEMIVNGMREIYERDVAITYETTVVIVRTVEPDPYTSSDAEMLLEEFRSHWNGNLDAIRRDAAHLMTGKTLFAATIGIARLTAICTRSDAYGLSQSRFNPSLAARFALTSHELGHNWDARHCTGNDCHIMCASIGGCSGDQTRFGAESRLAIETFRDSRGCLEMRAPALDAPFRDDFPGGTLDSSLWSYIEGAKTSTAGGAKPSEPRALNLDASGSAEFRDDEIRTNCIRLDGAGSSYASFFTNHKGVEAGETLQVEYFSSVGIWERLDELVSDGTDPQRYRFQGYRLPPLAHHDGFRMRFRSEVDQPNDDWFVDDVQVTRSPVSISVSPTSLTVRPGQNFFFTVRVQNHSNERQPFTAWLDAIRADGAPYAGNPVFGPQSRSIPAFQFIEKAARLRVPPGSRASGPHIIRFLLGSYPEFDAVATLEITIVP